MGSETDKCPQCGSRKSGSLDDNCPICLMRLGAGRPEFAAEHLPPKAGRRLGNYELLEEIARGGMGVIYRARQTGLNRLVAVKVLVGGQFADPSFVQRFRREAEAVASLVHPNIVTIHDIGEHEGQAFFSMELIEGQSLAELCRDQPWPARASARLLKIVSEAVQFAHERGVLHRDLKPSNVLIDAQGAPHVVDFGLAKKLETGSAGETRSPHSLTVTGQVLGSPNYMPPEQADPQRGPTTAASDVYSLGAILYHMLTGRPPFLAETVAQTLRLAAECEPVPPRLLNPGLARDLETICLKCLESDPQRRYSSAQELAAELGRFLDDESIHARPIGPLGRLARWRRREPTLAAALGAGLALLLVVLVALPVALIRINSARARAELAERETELQLYVALLEQARATVRSGEMGQRVRALDAIRRAARITNTIELQREALAALVLPDLRLEQILPTEPDCTMAVLDRGFHRVAIGSGTNAIEIRSVPDQRLLVRLPASTAKFANFGKWSYDGRFLGVCRRQSLTFPIKDLEIWDVASGQRRLLVARTPWDAFSFHPKEAQVLCPSAENSIALYDLASGRERKTFSVTGSVHHVEFSPDGRSFVVQHRAGGYRYREGAEWHTSLYDAESGLARASVVTGWIDGLAWHPQGRSLALATRRGEVHLHDLDSARTRVLGRHRNGARHAVFSPDGAYLFTGGDEQEIICWDLRSLRRAFTIGLQSQWLQFSADGERCAIPTRAGLLLHGFERSLPCREMRGDLGSGVNRGAISSDGRWLAASGTATLGLWDLTQDAPAALATNLFNPPTPVFTPDSAELLFFWREEIIRWQFAPAAEAGRPPKVTVLPIYNPGPLHSLGFSGDTLVYGTGSGAVLVARSNVASGPGRLFNLGSAQGQASPNGVWGAFRKSNPPSELVCRLDPWKDIEFVRFDAEVVAEAFTPRSDELAVATHTAVTFVDTNRWQPTRRIPVTLDRNAQILFMPDGHAFWLVHDARTAALHDTRTLQTLAQLPLGVIPLAISPDGRHLAVCVEARRVQVWDLMEVRQRLAALGLPSRQFAF